MALVKNVHQAAKLAMMQLIYVISVKMDLKEKVDGV